MPSFILQKSLSEVQPKFPEENSDLTFMTYIDQLLLSNTQTYMQPSQSWPFTLTPTPNNQAQAMV